MIKVSVLYPHAEGYTFDMGYYTGKHLALVSGLLGDAVKGATVEKGLGGAAPKAWDRFGPQPVLDLARRSRGNLVDAAKGQVQRKG